MYFYQPSKSRDYRSSRFPGPVFQYLFLMICRCYGEETGPSTWCWLIPTTKSSSISLTRRTARSTTWPSCSASVSLLKTTKTSFVATPSTKIKCNGYTELPCWKHINSYVLINWFYPYIKFLAYAYICIRLSCILFYPHCPLPSYFIGTT